MINYRQCVTQTIVFQNSFFAMYIWYITRFQFLTLEEVLFSNISHVSKRSLKNRIVAQAILAKRA